MLMKNSELLFFYSVVKKQREKSGYSCVAIKKRIDMINTTIIKEAVMFECRNEKEPNCKGIYRSRKGATIHAYCDNCGDKILIANLKNEQIDHDVKESKEKT